MSIAENHDGGLSDAELKALDALEEKFNRGEPWLYPDSRQPDETMPEGMPNPLVTVSLGLSTGIVKGKEMTFYTGVDRSGRKWSRLLGAQILKDRLIDGIEKAWDDDRQTYVETGRVGPARPGELIAINTPAAGSTLKGRDTRSSSSTGNRQR